MATLIRGDPPDLRLTWLPRAAQTLGTVLCLSSIAREDSTQTTGSIITPRRSYRASPFSETHLRARLAGLWSRTRLSSSTIMLAAATRVVRAWSVLFPLQTSGREPSTTHIVPTPRVAMLAYPRLLSALPTRV